MKNKSGLNTLQRLLLGLLLVLGLVAVFGLGAAPQASAAGPSPSPFFASIGRLSAAQTPSALSAVFITNRTKGNVTLSVKAPGCVPKVYKKGAKQVLYCVFPAGKYLFTATGKCNGKPWTDQGWVTFQGNNAYLYTTRKC